MESLRAQQGKAALRSPISGTVDKIYLNPGEMAGPGMPVLRVVNNDRVKIVADIPERFVGKFKNGDSVGVKMAAVERVISGRIRSVGQVIDVANRTFNLVVDPVSKSGREFLKPNMLAVVKIVTYKNKQAISVPTDLVRFEQEGTFLDIVEAGKVKRIPVETGEASEGFTEILSGLNGDEQIISEGFKSVSIGASVKVVNP
jgi:RND family efflux transporter MFP subunit